MTYKYLTVAVALAGTMLAAPAFAGVADPAGGTKTDKTTYHNDLQVKHEYRTEYRQGTSTTVNNGSGDASASGSLTVNVLGKDSVTLNVNASDPSSVREQLRDMASSYIESGREGATYKVKKDTVDADGDWNYNVRAYQGDGSNEASYWTGGGDWLGEVKYSEDTTKTGTGESSSETTYSTREENSVADSGYVYQNTTSKSTTTVDNGSIVFGSGDSINRMYVAQGSVNKTTDVTDHYLKTIVHTTIVYTDSTTTVTAGGDSYSINATVDVSPIVLDLDGDGRIEASNGRWKPHASQAFSGDNAVMFDFYGNGFPVISEWVGKTDGLLCHPREDGYVDGTNLFGTGAGYNDGFQALAAYDDNKDGQVSGDELNGLYVWTDVNGDGHAAKDELHTVQSLGISSISVNHKDLQGTYVRDGKEMKTFDWWPTIHECRKVNMAQK